MSKLDYPKLGPKLAALPFLVLLHATAAHARPEPADAKPGKVDLVIALDTSGSMDGLIDSARARLWDAVNLLAKAKPQPVLRVGLISYGNDGHSKASGWVRKETDLTTDLDAVYAKLFALRTNGGYEFVARATKFATGEMGWDKGKETLRLLFVAGNEPADQDPEVALEKAIGAAREKNIVINTIYCGNPDAEEARLWAEVASKGHGRYAAIDQNRAVVAAIATPHDAELSKLSSALNTTYIGYGASGREKAENQAAQDSNASSAGAPAAAARAMSKSSGLYRASDWDLVDAVKEGKVDVTKMKDAELPAELQKLPAEERAKWVEAKQQERARIQKRIADLSNEREKYITGERAKLAATGETGLDEAMNATIRAEATAAGFAF